MTVLLFVFLSLSDYSLIFNKTIDLEAAMKEQAHAALIALFLLGMASCTAPQEKAIAHPIAPISIADVVVRDEPIYIHLIGNVYAAETVQIRPQVGGMIKEIYIEEGRAVKRGDPLYLIDPRPYQAALERAEAVLAKNKAALEFAEIRLQRYANLVAKDYVSKLNYEQFKIEADSLRAQLLIDEADILVAKLNLEWTVVRSPIDGKSGIKRIDLGNIVTANDASSITDIQKINPIDIYFHVTQKDWIAVRSSKEENTLKFRVFLPQRPKIVREGNINFIDNHIDVATGTVLMKGVVDNIDELFWPGEFVQVQLELKVAKNALIIPSKAVQVSQEGPFVFIYDPNTSLIEYRNVKKGATVGENVIIEEGLSPHEKVVTEGQINLKPGSKATVAEIR